MGSYTPEIKSIFEPTSSEQYLPVFQQRFPEYAQLFPLDLHLTDYLQAMSSIRFQTLIMTLVKCTLA
jgi:hypothetical protein